MKFSTPFTLALLLAAASANAQTTSNPATGNVAGQASTQTQAGVPNPTQRPDGAMPKTRADVKAGARTEAMSPNTTKIPSGQASTVINGRPNATPSVGANSRAEVKADTRQAMADDKMKRAGEAPNVPTNPSDNRVGTPK